MSKHKLDFNGITSPVLVPFQKDGTIHDTVYQQLICSQLSAGIWGVFVGGTTGEFVSLSQQERHHLLALATECTPEENALLYNITDMTLEGLKDNIAYAKKLGVTAFSVTAPYYYKCNNHTLQQYFSTVLELTEGMDVYLYNMPGMTGNPISVEMLRGLAEKWPNLKGVKDSSMNYTNLLEIKASSSNDFCILTGNDAEILPALLAGCNGAISALANVFPKECSTIYKSYLQSDLDAAWMQQKMLIEARKCCRSIMPIATHKYMLELQGFQMGEGRYPLRSLTDEEKSKVRAFWESLSRN